MDTVNTYRKYIKDLLSQYDSWGRREQDWESQLIFDEKQDHYLWMKVGWNGSNPFLELWEENRKA
jgi:hypothetical protein